MSVAGTYDVVIKTPMGEQKGAFTVIPSDDGNNFTGNISGDLGSMDVKDGTINGNSLEWKMELTMPMPMKLECRAAIEGDRLNGAVKAGVFGSMDLAGQRQN
mgnify:CR=1 FL=1